MSGYKRLVFIVAGVITVINTVMVISGGYDVDICVKSLIAFALALLCIDKNR